MEISRILSLFLGLVAGMMFGIVYSKYEDAVAQQNPPARSLQRDSLRGMMAITKTRGGDTKNKSLDYAVGGNSFYFKYDKLKSGGLKSPELAEIASWQTFDPNYDADRLKSLISVFCVITIGPSSIPHHGKSTHETWTKHCNDFVMLSSVDNSQYNVKNINMPDVSRSMARSWDRTKMAFAHAVNAHPNHDWYVKAEHDSFVVVENLRHMLLMHQVNIPGFAGHVIAGNRKQGSVITLSGEAAGQAVGAFPRCGGLYGGEEDYKELEACLKQVGIVSSEDTRDLAGVNRFQMFRAKPDLPLNAHTSVDWSWRYIDDPSKMGQDGCCREYPVTFHYLSPNGLYLMEFMVYHMRPFGIGTYACSSVRE